MSYVAKGEKEYDAIGAPMPGVKIHKIRLTLTSSNVKNLEKFAANLINRAKDKQVRVKGPVHLPTKVLRITARKTPCGGGSKTWDRYELKVHKRLIDLHSSSEIFKQITSISVEPGVEVEVGVEVTISAQACSYGVFAISVTLRKRTLCFYSVCSKTMHRANDDQTKKRKENTRPRNVGSIVISS
ncbi:ribosomal protein S10 domain-containing protein [Mycena capillaripes]|nr:ribosomal protein S10 domain-containing protein [Mycena capillaripes]